MQFDSLLMRTSRRNNRPLLNTDNPRAVLAQLQGVREPIYALADMTVDSQEGPPEETVDRAILALKRYLKAEPAPMASGA